MDNSTLYERVMRHLPAASDDECWETTLLGARGGYPQITVARPDGSDTMRTISRLVYEMHYAEPIPPGMFVCHTCDNPRCINPHHLWLGTAADNNRDRHQKGRTVIQGGSVSHRKYHHIYLRRDGRTRRVRFRVQVPGHRSRTFARLADAVAYRDAL